MERVFASSEPLDASIDRILLCADRVREPIEERILPDGAVHLIFNLGDRQSGERGAELDSLVMGATCGPTRIVLAGTLVQVCVRLRVGAAAAVLGVPAAALTDHGVALDALWGTTAREALERLHAVPAGPARVAVMTAILQERLHQAAPTPPIAFEAVRRIAASGGTLRIGELAADLGVTDRRLQQIFHAHVGLSPKATCRLARFRAVLARGRRARGRRWTEVALESGFSDQAHLVHELKAFTGLTPTELARHDFGFFQDAAAAAG